jgi:hypothetical protein
VERWTNVTNIFEFLVNPGVLERSFILGHVKAFMFPFSSFI